MNVLRAICFILCLAYGLGITPSFASDLDGECDKFCKNNSFEAGQYLPPEPGAKCSDGYAQNPDNQICCCKPKVKE